MSWAKLDDEILDNKKIARAGTLGLLLHTAGITWCARNLTDGRIPKHKVRCLLNLSGIYVDRGNDAGMPLRVAGSNGAIDHPDADAIAEHLAREDVGLWHDRGDEWEIHDYLEYNPSREEVLSRREVARQKKRRQRRPAVSPQGTTPENPSAVPTHPVPVPVPVSRTEKRVRTKREETPWPDDFALTPALDEYGKKRGCTDRRLAFEFAKNKAKGAGRVQKDWAHFMRAWFDNHGRYGCPCQKQHRRVEELPGLNRRREPTAHDPEALRKRELLSGLTAQIGKAMP